MKKLLALLLALLLCVMGVAAAETVNPDDIDDTITSENGFYEIAFVTDVGQLKDKSFNEGTWNGVKTFAAENGMTYKYYQPANGSQATDDDRYDAMVAAVEGGAKVIVCAGFQQETALVKAGAENPDVMFIFIDGYPIGLDNVAPISFKEQESGYMAGYAVVKEGFTKLGFCGGGSGTNPACDRFGYGFAQGAEAAAEELGVDVELKYSWLYGSTFEASAELQTMANGWYEAGTEVIFACGGLMFLSIAAAAAENDAYVVGVDKDQSFQSETVLTSAVKGLSNATAWALTKCFDGNFSDLGGVPTSLGANDYSTGLPTETWTMENFTVEEYEAKMDALRAGEITIDDTDMTTNSITTVEFAHVTVDYID